MHDGSKVWAIYRATAKFRRKCQRFASPHPREKLHSGVYHDSIILKPLVTVREAGTGGTGTEPVATRNGEDGQEDAAAAALGIP